VAGTKFFRKSDNTNWIDWHSALLLNPTTSVSLCFDPANIDGSGANISGAIANAASGRPDSKYYDAIYASDVHDLRINAAGKHDALSARQALFSRAISGDARGWEAQSFTKFITETVTVSSVAVGTITFQTSASTNPRATTTLEFNIGIPHKYWLLLGDNGNTMIIKREYLQGYDFAYWPYSDDRAYLYDCPSSAAAEFNTKFPVGTVLTLGATWEIPYYQSEPTQTDILGDPANIVATFPDGVVGQWIPVIPDGNPNTFPMSKKVIDHLGEVYSSDNATFSTTTTNTTDIEGANNYISASTAANIVSLVNNETKANFTAPAAIGDMLDINPFMLASNWHEKSMAVFIQSLLGKIPVVGSLMHTAQIPINGLPMDTRGANLYPSPNNYFGELSHDSLQIANEASPACKAYAYLTDNNGLAQLQLAYKELVFDSGADAGADFTDVTGADTSLKAIGTIYHVTTGSRIGYWLCIKAASPAFDDIAWSEFGDQLLFSEGVPYFERWDGNGFGDNDQFEIADNDNTLTDYNGNDVKYGTHKSTDDLNIALWSK
jgi:hypothetical protein